MMNNAEERIAAALDAKAEELDLTGMDLTSLPGNFRDIAPQLEALYLSGNSFVNLPRELGACHNLKVLFLDRNKLQTLYGLASLRLLTELRLDHNEINNFPPEILELNLLEQLYLRGNRIAVVPAGINELQQLQSFDLGDNAVESLPVEIARLPRLEDIRLDGNPIKTPPVEVATRGMKAIRAYFEDLSKAGASGGNHYFFGIAIESYSDDSIPAAPGREAEVQQLAEVLEKRYDFQRFAMLQGAQATAATIRARLEELSKKVAERNDTVIIYFAGQVSDANGMGFFSHDMEKIRDVVFYKAIEGMRARHVLLIVDFYFFASSGGQSRSLSSERQTYSSRWILHRQDPLHENRFTPALTAFLNSLQYEAAVAELSSVLPGAVAAPLNLGSDEGGMFMFRPVAKAAPAPPQAAQPAGEATQLEVFKDKLRRLIAEAETAPALDILREVATGGADDEVILQAARFSGLMRENRLNLISPDDFSRKMNQINFALLEIIKALRIDQVSKEHLLKHTLGQPAAAGGATRQILDTINRKTGDIERLRNAYLSESSIEQKKQLSEQISGELEQLQALRNQIGAKGPASEVESKAEELFFEEDLWRQALTQNTQAAYEQYLGQTQTGFYRQEAQRAITELQLESEEGTLFQNIQDRKDHSLALLYKSKFPGGKYIGQVEALLQQWNDEDDALWQNAEHSNTIAAYEAYILQTRLGKYQDAAEDKKRRLEAEGSEQRINEAKLIFVGNGRVGKTSLTKRLISNDFDPNEPSTHGIRIEHWPLQLQDGRQLKVNIWDFGGQEIYHNTHRFFLTTRALYLLVWDKATQRDATENPDKEENFSFDYWLENVHSLSDGSPVLMVLNKMEELPQLGYDLSKYLNNPDFQVADTLQVSAAQGWNIDKLKNHIAEQFQSAPKLRGLIGFDMGPGWLAVRRELENLATEIPYIKYDRFLQICLAHQVSSEQADSLARFLTDIGTIIHFPDNSKLKEMVILNPKWTTRIIYRLLNQKIKDAKGRFAEADLAVNLREAEKEEEEHFSEDFRFRSEQEIQIFLELMRASEVCLKLPGEKEEFIVPQFLPEEKPAFNWDSRQAVACGYQYKYLHKGLVARAIVKLGKYAKGETWWRNGLLIEEGGTRALIKAIPKKHQIRVEIAGDDPAGMRKYRIEDAFKEINARSYVESIRYCPNAGCEGVFLETRVQEVKKKNQPSITCPACGKNVAIGDILGENIKNMAQPKIFISYAHKDETYKDELQRWLRSLQYSFEINAWEDRQLMVGDDWRGEISMALESADFIIMLLSTDFLASKFIKDVELKRALERHADGETVIIPIVIRPCLWKQTPIKNIQVIPKDARPVSQYEDKDVAWLEVTEKIVQRLEAGD